MLWPPNYAENCILPYSTDCQLRAKSLLNRFQSAVLTAVAHARHLPATAGTPSAKGNTDHASAHVPVCVLLYSGKYMSLPVQ
jgi:hypothetical protein